jgi:hypothetical protein
MLERRAEAFQASAPRASWRENFSRATMRRILIVVLVVAAVIALTQVPVGDPKLPNTPPKPILVWYHP